MNKVLRLVLLAQVLVLFCGPISSAQENDGPWLVSPELLTHSKLKIIWRNELPLKPEESLKDLYILGNRLYGFSETNYVVSMNRNKGNVVFSRNFVQAGLPMKELDLYEDELLSTVGNKLLEIGEEFGAERDATRLNVTPSCPVVRNKSYYYVAGTDNRLHVLLADNKVQISEAAAEDDSRITSVVADNEFVIFATESGRVISITKDGSKGLWQFKAADAIVGAIVRDGKSLYAVSRDTNVYKLNILTGRLIWKYQAEESLERSPRIGKKAVYYYGTHKGLTAIDKKSGKAIWKLSKGIDLLAESGEKAYVITSVGELVVMDNSSGKRLYSVNFAKVSKYATNLADSKIYIADKTGRVACLEPVK